MEKPAPRHLSPSRYWCFGLIVLIILLLAFIRFRLRDFPLERDEGEYAYAGQLILQGIPPYQIAYNMKFPGTYAAYAAILAVFGQTPAGIHLGLILVNTATTLFVYSLAARLFGRLAGVIAAVSFGLLSTSPSVLGLAGHATHFVVLPALAGILLLSKALEIRKFSLFFWSGVLLGLAFIMKQPGIFFVFFAGFYLVESECQKRPTQWRGLAESSGTFASGVIVPFGVTCLVLAAKGVFSKFWFWTFSYASEYVSILGIRDGIYFFWKNARHVVGPSVLIWILAAVGLTTLLWDRETRAHAPFLAGFLLFSFAAVCPGLYFRDHYFILMLPAIAILSAVAVSVATRRVWAATRSSAVAAVPLVVFLLAFGYAVIQQRAIFFQMDPVAACRTVYWEVPEPFPEALKIADYIKRHTSPGQGIAVLGSEPEIYFYSGRHSATGYLYTYGLMEKQRYALKMQHEMIAEIEAGRPEFVVAINVPWSWGIGPGSEMFIFSWARQFLQNQYEMAGIVDILQPQSEYRWGEDAKAYTPRSPLSLYIFRRKGG